MRLQWLIALVLALLLAAAGADAQQQQQQGQATPQSPAQGAAQQNPQQPQQQQQPQQPVQQQPQQQQQQQQQQQPVQQPIQQQPTGVLAPGESDTRFKTVDEVVGLFPNTSMVYHLIDQDALDEIEDWLESRQTVTLFAPTNEAIMRGYNQVRKSTVPMRQLQQQNAPQQQGQTTPQSPAQGAAQQTQPQQQQQQPQQQQQGTQQQQPIQQQPKQRKQRKQTFSLTSEQQEVIDEINSDPKFKAAMKPFASYHVVPGAFMLSSFVNSSGSSLLLPTRLTDPQWVRLGQGRSQVLKLISGTNMRNLSSAVSNGTFVPQAQGTMLGANETNPTATEPAANTTQAGQNQTMDGQIQTTLNNAVNAAQQADLRIVFLKAKQQLKQPPQQPQQPQNQTAQQGNATSAVNATSGANQTQPQQQQQPQQQSGWVTAAQDPMGQARIVAGDIIASNGVLHMIDEVVIPPQSLEQTLQSANLTDYLTLLRQSGMLEQINGMQGVTIFAPIQGTLAQLRNFTTKEMQEKEQQQEQQQTQQQQQQQSQQPQRAFFPQQQQQQPTQQGQTTPQSPAQGAAQQTQPQQPQQQQPQQQQQGTQQQQPIQQQKQDPLAVDYNKLRLPTNLLQQIVKSSIVQGVYYSPAFNFTHTLQLLSGEKIFLSNTSQVPIGFEEKGQEGARTTPLWNIGIGQQQQQHPQANATAPAANATAGNATSPANATAGSNSTQSSFRIFQALINTTQQELGGGINWSNSSILFEDLLFDGGVIHVVSRLLIPEQVQKQMIWAPIVDPNSLVNASTLNISNTFAARTCDSLLASRWNADQQAMLTQTQPNQTEQGAATFVASPPSWFRSLLSFATGGWLHTQQQGQTVPQQQQPQQQTTQQPQQQPAVQQQPVTQQPPTGADANCGPQDSLCWVLSELPQQCAEAYNDFKQVNQSINAWNQTGQQTAGGGEAGSNATQQQQSGGVQQQPVQLQRQLNAADQRFMQQIRTKPVRAQCFNKNTHVCLHNLFLCPHSAPQQCGGLCYSQQKYICTNHFTLCPLSNAQDCAGACYSGEYYQCVNGKLQQHQNATVIKPKL